jgi:hypothetical protein
MMPRLIAAWILLGAVLVPFSSARAGVIDYVLTALGGNLWRYDYTINNPVPSLGFDELTVYFDVGQYELLSAPAAPAGWDPIAVQPDAGIPSDGFFDALNLGAPLADGASVSGFSVEFAYLGVGTPGAQRYELLDSLTLTIIGSGTTELAPAAVPEPSTSMLALLGIGLAGLGRRARMT